MIRPIAYLAHKSTPFFIMKISRLAISLCSRNTFVVIIK